VDDNLPSSSADHSQRFPSGQMFEKAGLSEEQFLRRH